MNEFTSRQGRTISVIGDPALLTLERIQVVGDRFDADPRIASVSIVAHPQYPSAFLRATGPAGCLVALAQDAHALVGEDPSDITAWAQSASDRGFWHDWWLSNAADVRRAETLVEPAAMDTREQRDPSGSHFLALREPQAKRRELSVIVDATWLGPHETGAQVMTTAALAAMAEDERVSAITLIGLREFPSYALHLTDRAKICLANEGEVLDQADIIWYPNQIDQRSNIAVARTYGRRVVTTYLDLIAYDIPLYHASNDAWASYRAMQRTIALSVDGITTISADVADRLLKEVPRLDPERVLPLPFGLDHLAQESAPIDPPPELADLAAKISDKPFLLVLGNDFQHKNRDLAIQVWQQVLQQGLVCDLVLAGLHVRSSSSRTLERELLNRHVDLRGSAHTIGHVSSSARSWLLANAAVVLYPSSAEGFGLVPYEAAGLGTPSSFTRFGPLAEVADVTDSPRDWRVTSYAEDVVALLTNPTKAERRIESLRDSIAEHSWHDFARTLVDFFMATSQRPSVLTSALTAASPPESAVTTGQLSNMPMRAVQRLRALRRR